MLSTLIAAANQFVVAKGGAIDDPDSALFAPKTFKYTHTQIVGGLIVDITLEVLLLTALFYAAYRYWGPPSRNVDEQQQVTMRQEGVLLGLQPWMWSIVCMAFITVVVLASVLFYS